MAYNDPSYFKVKLSFSGDFSQSFERFLNAWKLYCLGSSLDFESQPAFARFVLSLDGSAKSFYESIVKHNVKQIMNDEETQFDINKLVNLLSETK